MFNNERGFSLVRAVGFHTTGRLAVSTVIGKKKKENNGK
jgi:hypothetical protein